MEFVMPASTQATYVTNFVALLRDCSPYCHHIFPLKEQSCTDPEGPSNGPFEPISCRQLWAVAEKRPISSESAFRQVEQVDYQIDR